MYDFETSENIHAIEVLRNKLTSFKYAFLNSFTQIEKKI